MSQKYDLKEILDHIDPSLLDYQEWVNVGMALKDEGYTASDWDAWSKRDPRRYHSGECFKKWDSFQGSPNPVTAGTIVQLAKDQGWESPVTGHELGWNDVIGPKDELVVVDRNWLEGQEVVEPTEWDPVAQLVKYLETLFEASELVGYGGLRLHRGRHGHVFRPDYDPGIGYQNQDGVQQDPLT